jgi:hypothetical protein
VCRDAVELVHELVVVELEGVEVGAPAHGVLGDQRRLCDLLLGGSEQPGGLRVEVTAVTAAGRPGHSEPDHLLVLVRDRCLVGELQALEARPLRGKQVIRHLLEELRNESQRLLDVAVDIATVLEDRHPCLLSVRFDHRAGGGVKSYESWISEPGPTRSRSADGRL